MLVSHSPNEQIDLHCRIESQAVFMLPAESKRQFEARILAKAGRITDGDTNFTPFYKNGQADLSTVVTVEHGGHRLRLNVHDAIIACPAASASLAAFLLGFLEKQEVKAIQLMTSNFTPWQPALQWQSCRILSIQGTSTTSAQAAAIHRPHVIMGKMFQSTMTPPLDMFEYLQHARITMPAEW